MGLFDWLRRREPAPAARRAEPRLTRSFNMAKSSRLHSTWPIMSTTLDADLRAQNRSLRGRARDLEQNSDYGKRFVQLVEANVVGHRGVMLQVDARDGDQPDIVANDLIEGAFAEWGRLGNCTVDGRMTWRDVQTLFTTAVVRDGEALIEKVPEWPGNRFRFALHMLEADLLDETLNFDMQDGGRVRMGIEFDELERPRAFHLLTSHPGADTFDRGGRRYRRIPAERILHAFRWRRISQSRGVTEMHTAGTRLNLLDGYEESELVAARTASAKMGFFTSPDGDAEAWATGEDGEGPLFDAEPGTFPTVPPGYDFKPWDPTHPTQAFPDFVKAMLRGASSGLGVNYNVLANDPEGVNFSSLRHFALIDQDHWRMVQQFLIERLCQPVFEDWLKFALLSGAVNLPATKFAKFNAARWRPRGWQWIDPQKEVDANRKAVKSGFKTLSDVAGEQGRDLEQIFAQLAAEKKLAARYGIEIDLSDPEAILLAAGRPSATEEETDQ